MPALARWLRKIRRSPASMNGPARGGAAQHHEALRGAAAGRPFGAQIGTYDVTGDATAEDDVPAALAAYRTAVEESLKVDNRLFLGLARSAAVALAARLDSPRDALAEFERVMADWDELGNVAAQWWVVLQVCLLLTLLGLDRPAALLAGAVLANGTQTYVLLGDTDRLQASIATLITRLGGRTAEDTPTSEGAALGFDDIAALARRTTTAARTREPTGSAS